MERVPEFRSEYLRNYLAMVEDTESPRLFHLWASLSIAGAALGRRCYLPFGHAELFPNQYILLIGNPGTRKSRAMGIATKLLKESTHVRFAPQDTAGQRQGLAKVMQGEDTPAEVVNGIELAAQDDALGSLSLAQLAEVSNVEQPDQPLIADADKHHIYVANSEFSRFIGQNNLQMLDFLVTMWDGEDYEYETKTGSMILSNPLINLISCTTPTSLSNALPPAAGGQGFLSRMILVYGARKYKLVPRPKPFDQSLVSDIKTRLSEIYYGMHGAFSETKAAYKLTEELYSYIIEITDSRFSYYAERRQAHMLKLGMILAAVRGSMEINDGDYDEAHRILRATERGMPDALGQFGLSPLAQVKQGILEFIRTYNEPVTVELLRAVFHRDARPKDLVEAINDLTDAKLLVAHRTPDNRTLLSARKNVKDTEDDILALLAER